MTETNCRSTAIWRTSGWRFNSGTATQHAWAAVEHELGYKNPANVSDEIAQQLYRLSALFDLADEQFSELGEVMAQVDEKLDATVRDGDLEAFHARVAQPSGAAR